MKIRHSTSSGQEKVELQMTPMIDIVFNLLIFFIMTFRIAAQEGDFNVQMPLASTQAGTPDPQDVQLPMKLQLRAGEGGVLAGIQLNDKSFPGFEQLHLEIVQQIGDAGPDVRQSAEVELNCDYDLRYEYVIAAITAVSGYVDPESGEIVKLVEKIRFSPIQSADIGG